MNNPHINSRIAIPRKQLIQFAKKTPVFVFSKEMLKANYCHYKESFPSNTEICYAVKANSEDAVLKTLREEGASFEAASKYELDILKRLRVPPDRIVYGTAIKPESHIKAFANYGVDRFAFDSEHELKKIAKYAPHARVYARALVKDNSKSVFTLSEKFGVEPEEAVRLLVTAKSLGLQPYGISFSVGSQARNEQSWANGIEDIVRAIEQLSVYGIRLKVINLGGGFPFSYQRDGMFPSIDAITEHIRTAAKKLPYPISFIIEPGRGLVANTVALITTVIAKATRKDKHWVYIDAGIYSALMEALTCQGSTTYSIERVPVTLGNNGYKKFILAGPTGDGLDVIHRETMLPGDIEAGDTLVIYDTGAYTTSLATTFNGFPIPKIVTI